MSKKLGSLRTTDSKWVYVIVEVDLDSGDVEEIDRCEDMDSAEKTCARLNLDSGHGPDIVHAFMHVSAFDALEEVPEDEDDDECGGDRCEGCF